MFADRLKKMREERGITQKALAATLNVTQQAVAKWERGKSEPNSAVLKDLADFFDCTLDYLVGKSDCKQRPKQRAALDCTAYFIKDWDELPKEAHDDIEDYLEFVRYKYRRNAVRKQGKDSDLIN